MHFGGFDGTRMTQIWLMVADFGQLILSEINLVLISVSDFLFQWRHLFPKSLILCHQIPRAAVQGRFGKPEERRGTLPGAIISSAHYGASLTNLKLNHMLCVGGQ